MLGWKHSGWFIWFEVREGWWKASKRQQCEQTKNRQFCNAWLWFFSKVRQPTAECFENSKYLQLSSKIIWWDRFSWSHKMYPFSSWAILSWIHQIQLLLLERILKMLKTKSSVSQWSPDKVEWHAQIPALCLRSFSVCQAVSHWGCRVTGAQDSLPTDCFCRMDSTCLGRNWWIKILVNGHSALTRCILFCFTYNSCCRSFYKINEFCFF